MPIDKTYNPAETEARLYERWEKSGAFACDPQSKAEPFCIMMPPPNVTGSLHMGHALNFTIQDILARFRRMQGRDVLWQPGTDHAGIATQMMVEKQLEKEGKNESRREMGREKFLARVWEWKKQSGDTITRQLRRLGASCDWSRERFTMDPDLNKGVIHAFVTLYREKLIYKDKRLVNWDPVMLTAVSDLEVEQKERKGFMWHFRYPLVDDPTKYICIATTRPETMLGDGAVAVNPKDERYIHLIGKYAHLPLANRQIPIIADEHADPEKGSGAVKITAAHDFNDFAVWQRHRDKDYFKKQKDGGLINLFDAHARMNENAPEGYRGLDRFAAREKVLEQMDALGLIDQIENITHSVPHGDRSGTVIEPWLSEQWYCDAKELAKEAIAAVEQGRTKFVPEQWTNTYYAWMRNIEPWCISRQLWWGHQIPAWYGIDLSGSSAIASPPKIFVAETETEALQQAQKYLIDNGENEATTYIADWRGPATERLLAQNEQKKLKEYGIWRDDDVLDTWFSSALWPFSTIGWPSSTAELKRYYPTDVLVTSFDIIFFWVARMMMMGMHFMKDAKHKEAKDWVPFKHVYIHALVRDEKGQKMSKTKGNVIDPIDIMDKYGCDALRFTMANMSTPGRDIRISHARIEGNRNFATKLWNAARYCQMNECAWVKGFDQSSVAQPVNKWIVGKVHQASEDVAAQLADYRFDLASARAYEFAWGEFCDWYLEFTKPILAGADEAAKKETRAATAWALGELLHLLHPFMPFITEEIWSNLASQQPMLIEASWLRPFTGGRGHAGIEWAKGLIESIRAVRSELGVPAKARLKLFTRNIGGIAKSWLAENLPLIERLAGLRADSIDHMNDFPKGAAQIAYDGVIIGLPLADIIDLDQERARLGKESDKWATEIKKIDIKLANKDFIDRAPPEVVEEHRERKAEAEAMLAKLQAAQKSLAG